MATSSSLHRYIMLLLVWAVVACNATSVQRTGLADMLRQPADNSTSTTSTTAPSDTNGTNGDALIQSSQQCFTLYVDDPQLPLTCVQGNSNQSGFFFVGDCPSSNGVPLTLAANDTYGFVAYLAGDSTAQCLTPVDNSGIPGASDGNSVILQPCSDTNTDLQSWAQQGSSIQLQSNPSLCLDWNQLQAGQVLGIVQCSGASNWRLELEDCPGGSQVGYMPPPGCGSVDDQLQNFLSSDNYTVNSKLEVTGLTVETDIQNVLQTQVLDILTAAQTALNNSRCDGVEDQLNTVQDKLMYLSMPLRRWQKLSLSQKLTVWDVRPLVLQSNILELQQTLIADVKEASAQCNWSKEQIDALLLNDIVTKEQGLNMTVMGQDLSLSVMLIIESAVDYGKGYIEDQLDAPETQLAQLFADYEETCLGNITTTTTTSADVPTESPTNTTTEGASSTSLITPTAPTPTTGTSSIPPPNVFPTPNANGS